MAYIAPNTTIKVLNGVPLSKDYEHTVRFDSLADQLAAFNSYVKYTFTAQSYQRYDKGTLRIQVNPDNIYDCNYLMFQNSSFGDKWFYAFIDSIEYINNITAEVRYTIDVMQTYFFNYNLQDCYVEREHSATDEIGENLVPESMPTGDLICHSDGKHNFLKTRMYTVIMYVPNYSTDSSTYKWIDISANGVPVIVTSCPSEQYYAGTRNRFGGGIATLVIDHNASYVTGDIAKEVQLCVGSLNAISASIVACFDIMGEMYDDNFTTQSVVTHTFSFAEAANFVYAGNPSRTYIPKNKKLFQYPFRRMVLTNGNGANSEYHWELFSTRGATSMPIANFEYLHALLPDPTTVAYPQNYRGNFLNDVDFENRCTIKDYPRQCYTEDSYAQWKAQNSTANSISLGTSLIGSMIRAGASFVSSGGTSMLRAGANVIEDVGSVLAAEQKAMDTPDSCTVQDNSPIINLLKDRFGFCMYDIGVTGEMAEVIDEYFDVYGYATNRVKTPNFVGAYRRPIWNYVKLQKVCMNTERLPAEAQAEIENIYKKGITFWETMALVGDYSANNAPRTP